MKHFEVINSIHCFAFYPMKIPAPRNKLAGKYCNFVNVANNQYTKKPNPFKETSALSHTYHFRTDI